MIIDSPIISGSYAASGSLNQSGDVVISGSLTVTGSIIGTASFAATASYLSGYVSPFPFTGSAIVSGSLEVTGSANIPSITGSLQGTASFAVTASNAVTASYLTGYISPFPFTGSAIVSGSLEVTGSVAVSNLQGTGVRYLVADSSGSITAQTASAAIKQTQAFTSSANQTSFTIDNGYTTGLVDVFINGTKLAPGVEFTDTTGTVITLATGSNSGDLVEFVKYFPASGVTNNALRQQTTFTASAAQTVFSASYTPGLLDIFYNGSRLSNNEYTANNGTFFTLATGSVDGDILDVFVYSYQVGAFSGIGGVGTADQIAFFGTTNAITGSPNFTISGSTMTVTGSLIVSGSGTFTNIGPAVFSGSLTSTAGFTGSFSGTATSASFASTASSADDLLVRGTLTAQTLVVQTITSSVDFVTGSTRFGSISENTHQFTGSVSVSGSLTGASASFSSALAANNLTGEGQAGAGGVLNLRQDAIYLPKGNGYSSIASSFSVFEFYGYTGASTYKNFTFRFDGLTDNTRRDYTLPDTSGTLALLSGSQTFNGATTFASPLTGSSAVFSGNIQSQTLVVRNSGVPAAQFFRDLDVVSVGSAGQNIEFGARSGSTFIAGALIGGGLDNPATTGTLVFQTLNSGTLGTRLTIASTGVATFSNRVVASNSAAGAATISTSNSNSSDDAGMSNLNFDGNRLRLGVLPSDGAYGCIGTNGGSTGLAFVTHNGSAFGERMRITPAGSVGIGTVVPNARLDLGTSYGASGEKFFIYNDDSSSALAGTKVGIYMDRFSEANSVAMVFPYSSGVGFGNRYHVAYKDTSNTTLVDVCWVTHNSTSWTFPSDERMKNIEGIIPNAIDKIKDLRAVYYTQKRDPEQKRKVGLLAQDLLKVLPEIVDVPDTEFDDEGNQRYMSVALADTIPLLVKAIQEQQTLITALQEKLERNNII
jgi:hypothetical protein